MVRYTCKNASVSQGCCPWPWSLVVPIKDKISVLGPGPGLANKSLVVSLEVASCMS